jgi:chaperonin GroES
VKALNDSIIIELVAIRGNPEDTVEGVAVTSLASGILLAANATERSSNEAIVVAVGPGSIYDGARVPVDLVKGDRILFTRTNAWKMRIDNRPYLKITEADVVCKLDDGERAQFVGETVDEAERKELLGAGR